MSILSELPDGFSFFYGFREGDSRRIDVRYEEEAEPQLGSGWAAYVGGERLAVLCSTKDAAEAAAIAWAKANPVKEA